MLYLLHSWSWYELQITGLVIYECYISFRYFDKIMWLDKSSWICCDGQNSQNLSIEYEIIKNFSVEVWRVNLVIVVSLGEVWNCNQHFLLLIPWRCELESPKYELKSNKLLTRQFDEIFKNVCKKNCLVMVKNDVCCWCLLFTTRMAGLWPGTIQMYTCSKTYLLPTRSNSTH